MARAIPKDITAPETTITSAPQKASNSASVTFEFASTESGSTFECSLDEAPFANCTPAQAYEALEDDFHIFEVRATDAAGNVDPTPARRMRTVDTFAPEVPAVSPSGGRVLSATNVAARFSEAMKESTVEAAGVMTLRTGAPLAALVDYDPRTRKATLDPSANLKRGVSYTAALTGGATDRAGNPLSSRSWKFTTKK